jgi:hypothetical protein
MTRNEPIGIRELSLEEIDGVGGGGSVAGAASSGGAGDEYGAPPSGAESLQNTYAAIRLRSSVTGETLLGRL